MDIKLHFAEKENTTSTIICKVYKNNTNHQYNLKLFKLAKYLKKIYFDKPNPIKIKYFKYIKDIPRIYNLDTHTKYIYNLDRFKNPWYDINNECRLINNNTSIIKNGIKYIYNNNRFKILLIVGDYTSKNVNDFKNSMSMVIPIGENKCNCKLSTNGSVQITGYRNNGSNGTDIVEILNKILISIQDLNNIILNEKYKPMIIHDDYIVYNHIIQNVLNYSINTPYVKLSDIKNKDKIIKHLMELDKFIYYKYNKICKFDINTYIVDIPTIMYNFNISNKSTINGEKMLILLDLQKLYQWITNLNRNDIIAIYMNSKNKQLKIYYKSKYAITITYLIYTSGEIIMTNIKTYIHGAEGYNFITELLQEHIENFIIRDNVFNGIQMLKYNDRYGCKQLSKEWFARRKYTIGASSVFKIIMEYPSFNCDIDTFIEEKRNKPVQMFNKYTIHGHRFEPLAQIIYMDMENTSKNSRTILYNVGSFVHEKNKFISASPDGLIFKIKYDILGSGILNYKNIPTTKELIKIFNNDRTNKKINIYNAYLLEIKCPMYYKKVYDNLLNEKPHYYYQVQQQMYVTGMNFCIFMNVEFLYYENRQDFINNRKKYSGYFYIIGYKKTYYPEGKSIYGDIKQIDDVYNKYKKMYPGETVQVKYWYVNDYDIHVIEYNKILYEKYIDKIKSTYDKIHG